MKMLTSLVFRTALISPKFEPSHFDSGLSNLAKTIAQDGRHHPRSDSARS